jgi:hypothetical protein
VWPATQQHIPSRQTANGHHDHRSVSNFFTLFIEFQSKTVELRHDYKVYLAERQARIPPGQRGWGGGLVSRMGWALRSGSEKTAWEMSKRRHGNDLRLLNEMNFLELKISWYGYTDNRTRLFPIISRFSFILFDHVFLVEIPRNLPLAHRIEAPDFCCLRQSLA